MCEVSSVQIDSENGPFPRQFATLTSYNNSLLLFGGYNKVSVNELWEYNTVEQQWTLIVTEPTKPRNAHVTALYDNKLYVFGGTSNGTVLNDFFYFNLVKKKWSKVKKGPKELWGASGVTYNTSLYVFGGMDSSGKYSNQLYRYSFKSRDWSTVECNNGPIARQLHASCIHGNKMYVFGGYNGNYLNDFWCFDFTKSEWFEIKERASRRGGHVLLPWKHWLFLHGGHENSESYAYNTEYNYWTRVQIKGNPPTSRYLHCATMHNNQLCVFGGLGLRKTENLIKNLNDLYKINLAGLSLDCISLIPDGPFYQMLQTMTAEQICMLSRVNNSLYKRWFCLFVYKELQEYKPGVKLDLGESELPWKLRYAQKRLEWFGPCASPYNTIPIEVSNWFKLLKRNLRIAVLGPSSVGNHSNTTLLIPGKTSLLTKYITTDFPTEIYKCHEKCVPIPQLQTKICLEIYDVQQPEEHSAMRDQYIRKADFFVFVYDTSKYNSEYDVHEYIENVWRVKDEDIIPAIIVGAKADLERQTNSLELEKYKLPIMQTSAKTGMNVAELFMKIIWLAAMSKENSSSVVSEKKNCIVM